jgi:hypothetical protein
MAKTTDPQQRDNRDADETAALRRFVDAVADLAVEPSAPMVARYLRASSELDERERATPLKRSFT